MNKMPLQYFRCVVCCWLLLLLTFSGTPAFAETTLSTPSAEAAAVIDLEDPHSKAAVRELVSTLNDDAVRALLIQRLDAVAEAKEQAASENSSAFGVVATGLGNYWTNTQQALFAAPPVSYGFAVINEQLKRSMQTGGWLYALMLLGIALVVGLCAERLVALFFRKRKQQLIEKTSTTLFGILGIIYTRLSFDLLGVLAFSLASYAVILSHYAAQTLINQALFAVTSGLAAAGFAYVVARFFFAPKRPDLRICNATDAQAMRLTVSYSLIAGYIVFIHNFFELMLMIAATEGRAFMAALGLFAHISIYIFASLIIWYNRHGLSEVLLQNKIRITRAIGNEDIDQVSWFAAHWPKIAITLLIAKYLLVEIILNTTGVGQYSKTAVYITFTLIFLWPAVDATISLFAWKSVSIPDDETAAAAKARRSMQQGLLRVGRVLVIGTVVFALAELWGLSLLSLAESGLGAKLAGDLLEVLLILLLAYICWELVSIVIDYWLAREGGAADDQEEDAGGGEIGGTGLSRVATILPIVQKTAKFLIIVVSIVMVLDNWGVNIGPILAGAGVLGLAIGFGAQTLVKDIVSGMFFLADDAFRVGEYIDVGGTMGNVEKISLRSLRLRHHRGLVHTIPYGEIPKLTNYSRDWVIMKLRFRVPFDTDVNKVKKIFKQIGKDLLEHPELGNDFLQPFKSQGVAEVDDNGLVVRGKFMAKPGKQFMIRKEVFVRVQKALEEAGIPFARKQVMVHIPGLDNNQELDKEDLRAISAAAAEAAEDEVLEADKAKKPAG